MSLLPEIVSTGDNKYRIPKKKFSLSRPCFRRTTRKDMFIVKDLARHLDDRTFVDYFNVFLSLPVFYQKALYRFSEKDFEFDPPIRRTRYMIDKPGLIKWILSERVPFFLRSDLYLEYLLSSELLTTSLHLTDSSHAIRDELKLIQEKEFICKHLGHVFGMEQFRCYLKEGLGFALYDFWMDAERFSRIPHDNHKARWDVYREMQLKYFKIGGLVELEDNDKWSIISESFTCPDSYGEHHACQRCSNNNKYISPDTFKPLQGFILRVLKEYWLQKYLIHCRCVEIITKTPHEMIRMRSLSDLKIVKEMKNVEQALSLVQGNLKLDTPVKKRRALASWNAMFPEYKVDDSFLRSTDEVITSHSEDDGNIASLSGVTTAEITSLQEHVTLNSSSEDSAKDEQDNEDSDDDSNVPVIKVLDLTTDQEPNPSKLTPQNLLLFDRLTDFRPTASNLSPAMKIEKLPPGLPNLKKPSMCRSFILPPISESKQEMPVKEPENVECVQGEHEGATVTKQDYKFTNTADGSFRYDNRLLVGSVAADLLAGSPLEEFCGTERITRALHFWQDSQFYLAMTQKSNDNAAEQIRFRKAKKLCVMYLRDDGDRPLLPPGLTLTLRKVLPEGKGHDLLRHAQDVVIVELRRRWKQFRRKDESDFVKFVLVQKEKPGKSRLPAIKKSPRHRRPSLEQTIDDEDHLEGDEGVNTGLAEKRSWCALRIASAISRYGDNVLPPDPLPYESLDGFDPDNDEGSLCVKAIRTVTRRDIEVMIAEEERKKKKMRAQMTAQRAAEERQRIKRMHHPGQDEDMDDTTFLDKPIRKNGQWVHRPGKPRHFSELLRCTLHLEYFKRYLSRNHAEFPLLFWLAVESLKKIKEVKKRQPRMLAIVKKFFSKEDIARLDCAAQVVMEIPNLERITPAMLMSAQTYVIRSLEDKWFLPYLETFVEDKVPEITISIPGMGRRTWGKERTRALWITFVRTFICFRRSIHNPIYTLLFRDFLKKEIARDLAKNQLSPAMAAATGGPMVKKVIRNRLVSVDRLISDLGFVIESDKYLTFCDNVRHAATTGTYKPEDEDLLEMKARAIVECYINSEVPPRLQINISHDMASTIIETYEEGILERGLFHDAMMAAMPVIMQLWKKFQGRRFANTTAGSIVSMSITDLKSQSSPDFLKMSTDGKRIKVHHTEDDHPRILFSFAQGLRYLIPTSRDDTSRPNASRANARRGTIGIFENASQIEWGAMSTASRGSSFLKHDISRNRSSTATLRLNRATIKHEKTPSKSVVLEEDDEEEDTDSILQIPSQSTGAALLLPAANV